MKRPSPIAEADEWAAWYEQEIDRLKGVIKEGLHWVDNYDGQPLGELASMLDDALYEEEK